MAVHSTCIHASRVVPLHFAMKGSQNYLELFCSYQEAIEDITMRMGAGMAKFICKEVICEYHPTVNYAYLINNHYIYQFLLLFSILTMMMLQLSNILSQKVLFLLQLDFRDQSIIQIKSPGVLIPIADILYLEHYASHFPSWCKSCKDFGARLKLQIMQNLRTSLLLFCYLRDNSGCRLNQLKITMNIVTMQQGLLDQGCQSSSMPLGQRIWLQILSPIQWVYFFRYCF